MVNTQMMQESTPITSSLLGAGPVADHWWSRYWRVQEMAMFVGRIVRDVGTIVLFWRSRSAGRRVMCTASMKKTMVLARDSGTTYSWHSGSHAKLTMPFRTYKGLVPISP